MNYFLRAAVILTIFAISFSCSAQKISNVGSVDNMPPITPSPEPILENDRLITMLSHRGQCFGLCPLYSISIYSTGQVVFIGTENVKVIGRDEKKLTDKELASIVSGIEKSRFFDLKDRYVDKDSCPKVWTDDITIELVAHKNERTKTIYHYLGCDGNKDLIGLVELEKRLDQIAKNYRWIT